MADLLKLQEALDKYVRLTHFPTAVKMYRDGEALPAKARPPLRDLGERFAICQGFAIVRRYGWSMALGREDISCPLAKVIWGFEPMLDYYLQGQACVGMYTETAEAGAASEAQMPRFPYGQYAYVVAAPLSRTDFEPDLILIYANAAQVMRLLVAALWRRGGRLHSSFSGRVDCADAVIVTMQTGEPQVVLPCNGDRIFAQTQDDEMAFTIPAQRIDEVTEGLEKSQRAGVRYPIPSWLRYTGGFPPSYTRMEEMWRESGLPGQA